MPDQPNRESNATALLLAGDGEGGWSSHSAARSAALLSAIVDSSDDAIISKNLDGVITSWNRGAERLFGFSADEAIGKQVTMLIPQDRLDEEPRIIARLKNGERVDHFETIRRCKDGRLVEISLTISPIRDPDGTIVGASKIARDITDRKHLETAQMQVEADLRRVNQNLEQFAFTASHDLQEPLRNVKIYSELLEPYLAEFDDQATLYLKFLRDGATRMERLVKDLLAYTQIACFERPVHCCAASKALEEALLNLMGAIRDSGAVVTSEGLPEIHAHSIHLQQLMQNLISNAIKYRHPDRSPIIQIRGERQDHEWQFSVADNGIGIADPYKEQIFGLFKRLHTTDQYAGTGIGLSICKRIVEGYRGRIWVESELGRGSTFKFTIPD